MNSLYRIIDANLNRTCEGLRVLEDLARFDANRADLCRELRELRHLLRQGAHEVARACLTERAAELDVGLGISQEDRGDERTSTRDLVSANFKRVQEGLRVLEEMLKTVGYYELAKRYEEFRFSTYSLEQRYLAAVCRPRAEVALDTDIYAITAEEHSLGRSNFQVVADMLAAGVKLVQYREKDKETGEHQRQCDELRRLTREAGAFFIVNDHPGLALMVEADGVHLGQDDYSIEAVRALVGPDMIIGVSTHSPEQAQDAIRRGADYIGVGPLYRTYTKKNVCEPVGLEYLDYAVAHVPIPFVALGGIKLSNVAEVYRRGARCAALVTEIVGAPDIGARIDEIRAAKREGGSQAA